mgnify:CR=1 FL=1
MALATPEICLVEFPVSVVEVTRFEATPAVDFVAPVTSERLHESISGMMCGRRDRFQDRQRRLEVSHILQIRAYVFG